MGRAPDYRLKILHKKTDRKNMNAGVGWENKDGSIGIQLSPCTVISGNDEDIVIYLFPIEEID
jgi:hypothetical protein